MAQIGTLPTVQPVVQPQASPGEFASPGAGVAELGQETANMAQANVQFEGHLAEAQRYLKYKQIEINVGQLQNQAHEALSKATTTEDAQQAHAQFKQNVDQALGPYMGDKVLARQLHLYGQQVDVEMQHTVNARKATIIQHDDEAANKVLYNSSVQEAINIAAAGGDPTVARNKLDAKLQSSVHVIGTMYPDQAEAVMQRFDKDVDKGTIKAQYNSPDPKVRKQVIDKLRSGQGFPHLDEADINAMLTSAEKRDRELSNMAMSNNLNVATEHFNDMTQGWTYEGKVNALDSDKWAKDNGFVDENGNVDRKTVDKLKEEADRQDTRQRKIQNDKDSDIIAKHITDVDSTKFSDSQIDKIVQGEGGSPKAASVLKSAMRQHVNERRADYRFGEYMAGASDRKQRRVTRAGGDKVSADLYTKIAQGEPVDRVNDIWGQVEEGNLTTTQAKQLESAWKKHQREDFTRNMLKVKDTPGMTQENLNKIYTDLNTGMDQQNLEGRAVDEFTDKLLADHGKKQTSSFIDSFFGNLLKPPAAKGVATTPAKPKGVPDGATWNPETKTWQLHQ